MKYVSVQGRLLKLTNLEKIFYPRSGTRKSDILNYYLKAGPTVIPYLRDRPFTLRRFPDGVEGFAFYEKQCPHFREKWIQTGWFGSTRHCLINDVPSLLWAVNLAAIELHTTLGKIANLRLPTMMMFDLDPGEGTGIRECIEVGFLVRKILSKLGLECYAKTSGVKGLHVVVPLNTSDASFDQTSGFARSVAQALELAHPDLVTARMLKKYRVGKIYVDWSQNIDFKSTTTVYSLRAYDRPTVSTPVSWDELSRARKKGSEAAKLLSFEMDAVLRRIERLGDLHAPVLSLRQNTPEPLAPRTRLAA